MEYRFIKKVSEGSFGRVDIVEDESGSQFARKTLLPQRRRDYVHRRIVKRFHNEVSFMSSSNHKNIIPIITSNLEDKSPWYVMPIATSSLRRDVKNLDKTDPLFRQAAFDILDGLSYTHEKGFYHRDICCANALRFKTGTGFIYRLSDFGAVTRIGSEGPFFKIDSGHYRYAPPEITIKPMIGSEKSDIYGFGAILHELFGEHERPAKKCIENESGALGKIMRKCTAIDPEHRYESVSVLKTDLEKALQ